MADLPKGPTTERGTTSSIPPAIYPAVGGLPGWAVFNPEGEHVPEWRDRLSASKTVDRMLYDSQLWSLYMGLVLPLLAYTWWIDPNGADEQHAQALADDLGLPLGEPADGEDGEIGPGLYRFNWLEHLWEATLALAYGHYYFEVVGEYADSDGRWHLRKLAPRPPASISEILTDPRDGGLRGIRQLGATYTQSVGGQLMAGLPDPIPVDALLGYVWLPDGGKRWTGRSMMRPVYREFLVKDRLLRVDAINHERAGGVPTIETDQTYQGASLEELRKLASEFRVGEDAGSALPPGARLILARAGGTDVVGSMRYLDEGMARAFQAMVQQLGQTMTGSRALGGTFADLEALLRQVIASWVSGTFREHLIEDWWSYNVESTRTGLPVPHPLLRWRPPPVESGPTQSAGASAVPVAPTDPASGGTPDPVNPPQPSPGAPGGAAAAAYSGADDARRIRRQDDPEASRRRGGAAVLHAAASLPARPLRREPFPHEVRAAVDFAGMDAAYETAATSLESLWDREWLPGMIGDLVAAVLTTKAGAPRKRVTRTAMAGITAAARGLDELTGLLLGVARQGALAAVDELLMQGVPVLAPSEEQLLAAVADHASAVVQQLADGVSLAGSRRAVQAAQGRSPGEVAGDVETYLAGLTHRWERDQLAGAVQQASNAGRFATFDRAPRDAPVAYHSSELLDAATCGPCEAEDGRVYASLGDAVRAYPTGGFLHCKGGPRCRGTVVAVMPEDEVDPVESLLHPELWGA